MFVGAAGGRGGYHTRKGIESGKWVVINSSKVSPSDCFRRPDGATKELNLAFGSRDRVLCNLNDTGKSFMELQKALQESLEAFLTSILCLL
jgi:hypothetical protein